MKSKNRSRIVKYLHGTFLLYLEPVLDFIFESCNTLLSIDYFFTEIVFRSTELHRRIIIASMTTLLLSLIHTPAQAKTLSASEIKTIFVGTTLNFKNSRGTEGTVIYQKNGSLKWTNENGYRGGGAWRLEGNKLCNKLFRTSTFNGRGWQCNSVKTRAGGKYKMGSGTLWR